MRQLLRWRRIGYSRSQLLRHAVTGVLFSLRGKLLLGNALSRIPNHDPTPIRATSIVKRKNIARPKFYELKWKAERWDLAKLTEPTRRSSRLYIYIRGFDVVRSTITHESRKLLISQTYRSHALQRLSQQITRHFEPSCLQDSSKTPLKSHISPSVWNWLSITPESLRACRRRQAISLCMRMIIILSVCSQMRACVHTAYE